MRRIFARCLMDQSYQQICDALMADGILDSAAPDFEQRYRALRRMNAQFRVARGNAQ